MPDATCPYCDGKGEVSGVVDDVEFIFECSCAGGNEESVRWLMDIDDQAPANLDYIVWGEV